MRTVITRSLQRFLPLVLILTAAVVLPRGAQAIDLPSSGSTTFLQTTGPDAPITVGDFYTNKGGGNGAHEINVLVPCAWDANLPITFALFDPEVAENDPTTGILADDEIRNASGTEVKDNNQASNTFFTLTTPNGTILSRTYVPEDPAGSTNGLWVELATLLPADAGSGCGFYNLKTTTGGNDDNAWVLRVGNINTCTVSPGSCSGIDNAVLKTAMDAHDDTDPVTPDPLTDDVDGIAGTGDEIYIGIVKSSYQQYPLDVLPNQVQYSCQKFYTYVSPTIGTVTFNNFDMDNSGDGNEFVRYYPPAGSVLLGQNQTSLKGEASDNGVWNYPNNATPKKDANNVPLRKGDTYTIGESDAGWWAIEACVKYPSAVRGVSKNQYIVEASSGMLFLNQPATPKMTITKDDGVNVAEYGQSLTYTMNFANTSNTTSTPGPASNVTLVDTLPAGTTYQSCAILAPYTGTCGFANGVISYSLNGRVLPGASGSVQATVLVNDNAPSPLQNTVRVDYKDPFGNSFTPVRATDIDTTRAPAPPTAVTLSSFGASSQGNAVALAWQTSSEIDSIGFYVLRSPSGSPAGASRISALVPAVGGSTGAAYRWVDSAPVMGATYWLEEVDASGKVTRYGPAKAAVARSGAYRIVIPIVWQ